MNSIRSGQKNEFAFDFVFKLATLMLLDFRRRQNQVTLYQVSNLGLCQFLKSIDLTQRNEKSRDFINSCSLATPIPIKYIMLTTAVKKETIRKTFNFFLNSLL